MIALRGLLVISALCMISCRKVPYAQPQKARAPVAPLALVAEAAHAVAQPRPAQAPAPVIDRNAQVIVIGYHRFVGKVRHPDTEITPADFEAQMNALKEKGITVIALADFAAWRRGEKNIPAQSAIITIDDGYRQAYEVAWPILKRLGYPCTLFIYTDYVKGGPKSGGGSMSWEELAEMRDGGVAIQSHTVSHSNLRGRGGKAGGEEYDAWLWKELHGSKEQIEQNLGIKVTALALPYGLSNERVREVAAKAGYEMVFTVNGKKLGCDTPLEALGRYMIDSSKPKIFATAVTLDRTSHAESAVPFAVRLLDPQPADGSTIKEARPLIRAHLSALGAIEAGSVTLRISGIGVVPAKLDPTTEIISFQTLEKLSPNAHTVIISAKVDGRKTEARWSYTVRGDEAPAGAATKGGAR